MEVWQMVVTVLVSILGSTVLTELVRQRGERNKKNAETGAEIVESSKSLYDGLSKRIDDMQADAEKDRDTIEKLDCLVKNYREEIEGYREEITALQKQVANQKARLAEKDAIIQGLERDVARIPELEAEINQLRAQLNAMGKTKRRNAG